MDIKITNLNKTYDSKPVLQNFNAVFKGNKCTCIMGPSGCGKTTLFNILLGLEKADSGSITGIPDKISAVFQEDRLCMDFSPIANIELVTGKRVPTKDIVDTLCKLNIGESIHKPVSLLSGGMQRRVAIARAVLYNAPLILLDEPFKGLDSTTKELVMDYLCTVCKDRTVVFITHDAGEAEYMADKVIYMG